MSDETVTSAEVDTGTTGGESSTGEVKEPSFRQYIPEEFKDADYWASIPDEATLVKNYANAQKLIGKKGIIRPDDDAPQEEWDKYYGALGRPEAPDKYSLEAPKDFPKEFYREDLATDFRNWAYEAGLNEKQAGTIFNKYLEKSQVEIAQGIKAIETAKAETERELKAEWGDKYQENIELANYVIRECGDQKVKDSLEAGDPVWNNPNLARFLVRIGQSMSEASLIKGGGGAQASLDAKLAELARNPALLDEKHPDHAQVVAERDRLMKLKYDR